MTDGIAKARTGIDGFDDLTLGGLPRGQPTLVCGSAGCGKTLFASTFLINGARHDDEPGVFVTFEERPADIVDNVASLGFGLDDLIAEKKVHIEHIAIDPAELAEVGDYDLEGSDRVAMDTPSIRVPPDTAVALGLIFHELVTNAVKYGALSNETGRVAITGSLQGDALEIVWQETGGPAVSPLDKSGFGQTVIARGLGKGGTHVEFHPEGIVCRMTVRPSRPETQ